MLQTVALLATPLRYKTLRNTALPFIELINNAVRPTLVRRSPLPYLCKE